MARPCTTHARERIAEAGELPREAADGRRSAGRRAWWLSHRTAHRVLIAGGGIAGLEAMIALRRLAGHRLCLTLLSPGDEFLFPSLSVQDAFAGSAPRRYPLSDICAEHGAALVHDELELVEVHRRRVITRGGREVPYDALAIAVGANRRPALRGATTFRGPEDTEAIHGIAQDVEGGYIQHIAFIVPPGVTWPLPLYEVALMTAERARSACVDVKLTIVTPEQAPLGIFGRRACGVVPASCATQGSLCSPPPLCTRCATVPRSRPAATPLSAQHASWRSRGSSGPPSRGSRPTLTASWP
jgi:sulfide:quinone oxidoreductase